MTPPLVGCVWVPHFVAQAVQLAHGIASPFVVASGTSDRSIVVDVCPEAAALGVDAGIPVLEVRRRCSALQVIPNPQQAIDQAADCVEHQLLQHADQVTSVAVGAWTLPLYALGSAYRGAQTVAQRIRKDVAAHTGFACVLGMGTHPVMARIAAGTVVEDGCTIVLPGSEGDFLAPLPVGILPGVGAHTRTALQRLGIATVGQLAHVPASVLEQVCGSRARSILLYARGMFAGPARGKVPTIAASWHATDEPCADECRLAACLVALVEQVGRCLRRQETAAGVISVRVRWTDGMTRQQTCPLVPRRDLDRELTSVALGAFGQLLRSRRLAVCELRVVADDLGPAQHTLFGTDDSRPRRLQQAVDHVKQRYGPQAIQAGALLGLAARGMYTTL